MLNEKIVMEGLGFVNQTRRYLDYLEKHLKHIARAWSIIEQGCRGMRFLSDDYAYDLLRRQVESHDVSKFSEMEFTRYRKHFYSVKGEKELDFDIAWQHHILHNSHHWEGWVEGEDKTPPYGKEIDCVHMVINWMAMSFHFGGDPREYYEKNRDTIKLSEDSISFIYEIFSKIGCER